MNMSKVKRTSKVTKTTFISPFSDYWTKGNLVLTIAAVAIITFGYILMAQGPWDNPVSLTVSPIVLIIAYVVVVPAAILFLGKKKETTQKAE